MDDASWRTIPKLLGNLKGRISLFEFETGHLCLSANDSLTWSHLLVAPHFFPKNLSRWCPLGTMEVLVSDICITYFILRVCVAFFFYLFSRHGSSMSGRRKAGYTLWALALGAQFDDSNLPRRECVRRNLTREDCLEDVLAS